MSELGLVKSIELSLAQAKSLKQKGRSLLVASENFGVVVCGVLERSRTFGSVARLMSSL